MIEIKQKVTGTVLLNVEADTLLGADLSGANLSGAYLNGVRLLQDQQSDLMSALGVKVMP